MRVQTAFKRMLRLPGASVADVGFGAEGVIVTVALRRRRRVCSRCGQTGRQLEIHDRRVKRWRHLDLGANRCVIECELRRLWCRDCGAQLEAVPWARTGSPYKRDFEDLVAWLRSRWPRSRSPGCCGSPGIRSGRSSRASSPIILIHLALGLMSDLALGLMSVATHGVQQPPAPRGVYGFAS